MSSSVVNQMPETASNIKTVQNKQQEQTINTHNRSFQQNETAHLNKMKCVPLENSWFDRTSDRTSDAERD